MSYIIDRRLNSKEKSAVNRQRFLRRYRDHIKKAVSDAVSRRSITDIENGESIGIPKRDLSEPSFGHGEGGRQHRVLPGNKEFVTGDKLKRPESGGQGQGGQASDSGEGEDDFVFQISQKEFLDYMFQELELPNLVKRQLVGDDSFKYVHAGFSNVGNPGQISIERSMRSAHARRMALGGSMRRKRRERQAELDALIAFDRPLDETERLRKAELEEEIAHFNRRLAAIPFIDDFDLRYNLVTKQPQPSSKAVMFCLMDVSGSMDQETKDIAKRFFILLYLFLRRNYEKTEVVFIRHHSVAKEVDEEEFFYSRETGGTVVSSALKLTREIIADRFPISEWNLYVAQASDGDNWSNDSPLCKQILSEHLIPLLQYYCYIEITERDHQELWEQYESVREAYPEQFAMQQIMGREDIYPVFRALFQRRSHE